MKSTESRRDAEGAEKNRKTQRKRERSFAALKMTAAQYGGKADPSGKRRLRDDNFCWMRDLRTAAGAARANQRQKRPPERKSRRPLQVQEQLRSKRLPGSMKPNRPLQRQVQRQRRPAKAGRYKFKGNINCKEPARRRRYQNRAIGGISTEPDGF